MKRKKINSNIKIENKILFSNKINLLEIKTMETLLTGLAIYIVVGFIINVLAGEKLIP